MSFEMKVPTVGESITEVTIASWLKSEGDFVEQDEIICELESDKATFELAAETSGKLSIAAQEGEVLPIGAVICKIEESVAEPVAASVGAAEAPIVESTSTTEEVKATGEVVEMTVPTVGESITEVTIATWAKEDGDFVEAEELLCEIESDKATFELMSEHSGIVRIIAQEGDTVEVGQLICKIEVTEGSAPQSTEPTTAPTTQAPVNADANYATGHASPAAKKILDERGIDASQVQGSGVNGRITKEDALNAEKVAAPAPVAKAAEAPKAKETVAAPAPTGDRDVQREKMSSMRRTIAKRLVSVKNETAMLTTFNEVDMKPIMDIRKKYKEMFKEKYEVGLGFMSFFTKAVTVALQEWPAVNAQIDGNEIIYSNFCDISVAVSTPKGLVVPVIRNAEKLSFNGVESEIIRLAKKARDGKLSIDEMMGGTFTITNGGVFGSMLSTPIINAPQSAILGMHNIVERPVAINGQVEIRPIMYVALSYDHRIIDGRESVSFLKRVKELLEDPTRLLLGV